MTKDYKPITIRRAGPADAADILRITKEAFEKYAFDLGQPELVHALHDGEASVLRDIAQKTVYIAFLSGEPVGTIRYEACAGCALITRFAVVLHAQSLGVGGALIQQVVAAARREGYAAVCLHTSSKMASLIRFYYGQGFYIRTTATDRGYVRALLVHELQPDVEIDIVALKP